MAMKGEFTCTPQSVHNKRERKREAQQHQQQRSQQIDDLFETHYFFNHIMAIQKRMSPDAFASPPSSSSPSMPSILTGGGSQCLSQAFINANGLGQNTQAFTDITLRLHYKDYDNNTLHQEIRVHRVILAACSNYFARMFDYAARAKPAVTVCDIYLEEAMSNQDAQILLPQFFALFYQPVLDDTQFSIHQLEQIVAQVLTLRTLATQFLFTALEQYLTHKLYERLDVQVFVAVFMYCLVPGSHQIISERCELFRRLIAWFVCCADIQDYHVPHLNRIMELQSTGSTGAVTTTTNDEHMDCETGGVGAVPTTTTIDAREKNRKRKRLSTSNDAKIAIFDFIARLVPEFDSHDVYSCRTRESTHTGETEIRLFQRVCTQCIGDKKQVQIMRANQAQRKWFFYLDLTLNHHDSHSTLHAKIVNTSTGPGSSARVACRTTVTLLSRLFENRPQCSEGFVVSELENFTSLLGFRLHDQSHCYLGECDVCHSHSRRIYVVRYEVLCKNVDK